MTDVKAAHGRWRAAINRPSTRVGLGPAGSDWVAFRQARVSRARADVGQPAVSARWPDKIHSWPRRWRFFLSARYQLTEDRKWTSFASDLKPCYRSRGVSVNTGRRTAVSELSLGY